MQNKHEQAYDRKGLSHKARHRANKEKLTQEISEANNNNIKGQTQHDGTVMPMRATGRSNISTHNTPKAPGVHRVHIHGLHDHFFPQNTGSAEQQAIQNDMLPILNSNSPGLGEAVASNGSQVILETNNRTGVATAGNIRNLRTVTVSSPARGPMIGIGGGDFRIANGRWGGASGVPRTEPGPPPDPYRDMVIQGSEFRYEDVETDKNIQANSDVKEKIVPILDGWLAAGEITRGMHALIMVHAIKEGYSPGTRAYRYNNPGNVGNTDEGANKGFDTVEDGLRHLKDYINRVASGQSSAYRFGPKTIEPYYSQEIEDNRATYQMSPYLPGYEFEYSGQIDQYVKIYATSARQDNSYLSMIISYFNMVDSPSATSGRSPGQAVGNLQPDSKIQDIINLS